MSQQTVRFCNSDYNLDTELGPLRDSSDCKGDAKALRKRLMEDGYLYMRNVLDREEVLEARRAILSYMAEHEGLEPGARPLDGVMGQYGKTVPMLGRPPITHHPAVKQVLESSALFDFYKHIFGSPALTYDYKWLRAVGNEEATGCHMDHVYMGRGSKRLMTCWVPFGDLPIEQGTLAICKGSHNEPGFEKLRNTYGKMDVDRDNVAGWFTMNPREITDTFGGRWLANDVRAGDLITFGMHLMHASTTNITDRWRISCDIRFQPAEEPADQRWIGQAPGGHHRSPEAPAQAVPIEEARKKWGV